MAEAEIGRLRRRKAEMEAENAPLQAAASPAGDMRDHRYQAIFKSAVDFAIIATDRDGRITDWNPGAERILGWSAEDMWGEPVDRLFTPEDRAEGRPAFEMRHALEAGRASDDRWHLRSDGSRFWASGEMMPLRSEDRGHLGFLKILRDRTERKEADLALRNAGEELRLTSARLQLALDAGAVLGSWVWDIPADRVTADARLAQLFSLDPEAATVGLPIETFAQAIHLEDRPGFDAALAGATRSGGPFRMEYRLRPNGRTRWIEAVGRVDLDPEGRPARCLGVLLDITERKRAETARRVGHERFFQAVNATGSRTGALIQTRDWSETPLGAAETWPTTLRSAVGLCLNSRVPVCIYWGPEFTLLYNDPWSSIPGDKHPWALGRPAREAWADIWSILEPMFNGVRDTGVAVHTEDGLLPLQRHGYVEECYFNYNVSPIHGEDGQVAGLFNAAIETTYRVIAERRATLLRTLLDRTARARTAEAACAEAAQAIASDPADLPFCLVYLVERQNGTTRAMLAGWTGLTPGGTAAPESIDLAAAYDAFWPLAEAHRDRHPVVVEDLAGRTGDPLVLEPWPEPLRYAYVAPIANPARAAELAGFLVVGLSPRRALDDAYRAFIEGAAGHVATGIANARAAEQERRATEELETRVAERSAELARTQEALVQAQKMEAVGQLTGGLAHDFNNLLTGITGSLELLKTRVAQGRIDSLERYVDAAQGAASRAVALTHRLLTFSRRQTLDPKPTNMNRLVAGMEELLRRTMGPEIAVEVVAAGGLWNTLVDPHQLENALLNLCINARDAMPDGGRLTIETANRWLDGRAARERELPPGQYVSLGVSDTGSGMTPEVVRRAFDPFFTTKPIGQGTGLGLSMVYGFARQSGGQARIHSELGRGTTACLYLPRCGGEEEFAELSEVAEAPRVEPGKTVLVVDDEPTVRMLVAEVLEDQGHAAIEAADGAAGLEVLHSEAGIDLLVTDIGLPGGMNGRQLADAARALRPELKVLFITGYAENAVVGNDHLDPGMHVLTKPFAMEVLASRINDLIVGT